MPIVEQMYGETKQLFSVVLPILESVRVFDSKISSFMWLRYRKL
jgi:hypothetical protein